MRDMVGELKATETVGTKTAVSLVWFYGNSRLNML